MKGRLGLLIALLLGTVACLPLLLAPGLVSTRAGGDSPFLLVRLQQMVVALRGGAFPVRWMPDAAYGLGYPFFNYYAPLPYYLAALFHFGGLGTIGALKLTQIMGFLAATASMYLLARDLLGDERGAFLASLAYTYAPFHLVNVYVRGDSLGEFYAFIFYPLIFLALRRLRGRPSPGNVAFLALAYGGLVLSHNISALAFSPFVALWLIVCGVSPVGDRKAVTAHLLPPDRQIRRPNRLNSTGFDPSGLDLAIQAERDEQFWRATIRYVRWAIGGLLLGLALSAWYWAPALLERGAVHLEGVTTGYFHYAGHFRSLDLVQRNLLFDYAIGKGRTPFAMGLVQALLALLGALAIAIRWRRWPSRMGSAFFLFLLLATTWLITPLSRPLWDHVPLLPFVQFPWRLLSIQAFAASLLIGHLAICPGSIAWRRLIACVLGLAIIATAMLGLRVEVLPISDRDVTPEHLALYELFTANIGSTVRAEYLPQAVEPRPYTSAVLLNGGVKPPPLVAEGELATVQLLAQKPAEERWRVGVASSRASLAFYTHWFPGWRATVDGRPAESGPVQSSGLIGLDLPQGEHEVLLRFERTPVRAVAEGVSLLGFLGVLAWLIVPAARPAIVGGAIILMLLLAAPLVASQLADGPTAPSTLTMDFDRMPYLHPNPQGVRFGDDLRLRGYTLSAEEVTAGESFTVTLTWEAVAGDGFDTPSATQPKLTAELALVSPAEHLFHVGYVLDVERRPLESSTSFTLSVPCEANPGLYLLRLQVWSGSREIRPLTEAGEPLGTTCLSPVRLLPPSGPRAFQPMASMGDVAALGSVEAERVAPDRLEVWMDWQVTRSLSANYVTSLRLRGPDGELIAQKDKQPCYGFCPTTTWAAGVPVRDRRWLPLPKDIALTDAHRLEVILYDRPSLQPVGTAEFSLAEVLNR